MRFPLFMKKECSLSVIENEYLSSSDVCIGKKPMNTKSR